MDAPDLGCLFPRRLHERVDQIETEAEVWAARVGLGGYEPARFGWLGAACYPYGELDRVLVATNLLQWVFGFDDYIDEAPVPDPWRTARQALLSVRVAEDPDHLVGLDLEPCLTALDDIVRRLRAVASPAQYQRFVAALTEWVLGQVCGSLVDTTIKPPEYPTLRRYSTNGVLCFALIDVAAGVELPDDVWRRPDVASLTRVASDIMGYTNDVHSAAKEQARDPDAVNLPSMIARDHQVPLAEAIHLAAGHVNTLHTRFQNAVARLRPTATPALTAYLTGLEAWIAGQHHWYAITRRYATTETS